MNNHIGLNVEIKIESAGLTKINPEKLQILTQHVFSDGEIIKAEVISQTADHVVLRTPDGVLFHATLLKDIQLSVKDQVELLIETKGPSRFVMHLLSAEQKEQKSADTTVSPGMEQQYDQEAANIAGHFKSIDVKPTIDRVFSAINILRQHPSLSPRAAVFLIANKIPATRQNVTMLEEMMSGKNFMNELADLYTDISDALDPNGPQPPQAALKEERALFADLAVNAQEAYRQEPMEFQNSAPDDLKEKQTTAEGSFIKTMTSKGTVFKFQKQPQQLVVNEKTAGEVPNKGITEKIRSFFILLRGEKDGRALKSSADNIIKNLFELKFLLQNSDLKNKDQWVEKLDRIYAKAKFSSDIDRFTCLHLPVQINQHLKTVELLVYKRRKDGKKSVDENTVLLIALDTENFGRLETLVRVEKHNLSILFKLNDQNAADMIKERTQRLYKKMDSAGFILKDTKIVRLTDETTVEKAEQVLGGKASSYVDYRI